MGLVLDLRYAWRGIRKARGFTAVILLTLALGIGANTTIFSIVHAMLIEPLPYRDADRLAFIWLGYSRGPLSGPDFRDIREGTSSFSEMGGIWASGTVALTSDGDPEQLRTSFVTTNFFSPPRRRARLWPDVPRRGRPAGRAAVDPARMGSLHAQVRRRSINCRPADSRRRRADDGDRRDAAGVPAAAAARLRRAGSPAGVAAVLAGVRNRTSGQPVHARRRTHAPRRHDRAGARGRGRRRPQDSGRDGHRARVHARSASRPTTRASSADRCCRCSPAWGSF